MNIEFGIAGPPCVDMTIKNNKKITLSTCAVTGKGRSGSGVHMTGEFMKKYRPLVMIVEMVLGANIKYQSSMEFETDLKAMESNFSEKRLHCAAAHRACCTVFRTGEEQIFHRMRAL